MTYHSFMTKMKANHSIIITILAAWILIFSIKTPIVEHITQTNPSQVINSYEGAGNPNEAIILF